MDYRKPRGKPEAEGANRLKLHMQARGWVVDKIGGSKFAVGWPDLFCWHPKHGLRWIETKAPGGKLRKSQYDRFHRWKQHGLSVYVLEDETHYQRLFLDQDNWEEYIRW